MKCKVKVGDLREALQTATITVDRRAGSELGYVYLAAKKAKGGTNQRMVLSSTDGIGRFLLRAACEVEEVGDLVIEPVRLSTLLDRRGDDELVTFVGDPESKRTVVRCGGARVTLSSADRMTKTFEALINEFPHKAEPTFSIESANLKALLDRTQAFIYRKEGQEHMKSVLIRSVANGYEALSTNRECVAKGYVVDPASPGLGEDSKPTNLVEIPARALPALSKMLGRNKTETIKVIIIKNPDGKDCGAYFRTELAFFGTGLMDCKQPRVDVVFGMQQMVMEVEAPRGDLLISLSRSNPFCSETIAGRLVCLDVKNSIIRLSAQDNSGEFEEELASPKPAVGTGKATFRADFLSDALRSSDEDTITLKIGTNGGKLPRPSAMLISGTDNGAAYVIGGVAEKTVEQAA